MIRTAPFLTPAPIARRSSDVARFFTLLYGEARGFVEVAWIGGDPDDRVGHQFGRRWFAYAPERLAELVALAEELGGRYGNVYVSAHQYASPRRDAPVLPGRAIVVDDLPAEVPCSFSVQTSPRSRHGYFLLDGDAPPEELRELARRAAYSLGGDRGGWDAQQLVRVPGTFNTKAKHGGRFPVTLREGNGCRYAADELRRRWPEAASAAASSGTISWPEVERWLGNLHALVGDNGLPRRVKPTTQTGRVLQKGMNDTSLARYIVARGLVMHGYPDAEAAALLWHYCDYDKSNEKGSAWLQGDIERVLAKVRAELPDITPSPTRARAEQPAQALPQRERARRGRKVTLTPERLLAWYEGERSCGDTVLLSVGEVVRRLGVSRATVERCERALRERGAIERRCFTHRQASLVVLRRPLTNAGEPAPIESAAPEAAESRPLTIPREAVAVPYVEAQTTEDAVSRPVTIAAEAATHVPSAGAPIAQHEAENRVTDVVGGTHAPDGSPRPLGLARPVCRPTPRAAVAEAFEHFAHRPRVTRQMVAMFLDSKYPELRVDEGALARLIAAERERRAWDRQVARLRTMPHAALARLSRKVDRLLAEGLRGAPGPQHGWASAMAPHVAAELSRREPMNERASPQKARRRHSEYIALADQALDALRAERAAAAEAGAAPPQAGASRGVCTPRVAERRERFTVDAARQEPGVAGMIARLHQLKAEREAGERRERSPP
jgi:hypothetical protein